MRLFIDGTYCGQCTIKSIPIAFDSSDLVNPQSMRSGREITLTVKSTPTTDAIFGTLRDMHATARFNSNHHTAKVEADGIVLFEGTVFLISSSSTSSFSGEYTLRIVSASVRWAKSASKTSLRSCGISLSTTLTPEDMIQTWSGITPVRFLPVLRNRYSMQYSNYSDAPLEQIMTTDDFHPFISVDAVFNKIFKGYTVKSDFLMSSEFKQLMFSGQYSSADTTHQKSLLDFFARRASPATAIANYQGKVWLTPGNTTEHSLGNVVDTADPTAVDHNGKIMYDTFATSNCFGKDKNGYIYFKSPIAAKVGFILHLEYITSYKIESRKTLKGFNHIEANPGVCADFTIANTFEDHKNSLIAGLEYHLAIFGHTEGNIYLFKVQDAQSGEVLLQKSIEDVFVDVTMPENCTPVCSLELMIGEKTDIEVDWALYPGWVAQCGKTEVITDIRIPPQDIAAGGVINFNQLWISGAEEGMEITLTTACSLKPYFSTVPGYGSNITFKDISHNDIWLIEILEAICTMFNLAIFTDEETKSVIIEPLEELYTDRVFDWSHKIDYSKPITISDMGIGEAQWRKFGYKSGNFATEKYNKLFDTELGVWSVENPTFGATDTTNLITNPLFTTAVNSENVYAVAPSASLVQVGDKAAEGSMDAPFTPNIIRYAGIKPLPEGENWGSPINEPIYPLAAFHFPGNKDTNGFTLCYEDRDGVTGLHQYFDKSMERIANGKRLSATLKITPLQIVQLLKTQGDNPTVRDNFKLTVFGQSGMYRIESIKSYNPQHREALCTFIQLK